MKKLAGLFTLHRMTTGLYGLLLGIACFIVVINILSVLSFHFPYLRRDEWNFYALYLETELASFLWHRYVNHVVIVPKLLFAAHLEVPGVTTRGLTFLGLTLNGLVASALGWTLWHHRGPHASPLPSLLAIALLVASVLWMARHLEFNWLLASITYAPIVAACTLAAWALWQLLQQRFNNPTKHNPGWWAFILTGCGIATISFGSGLAAWPAIAAVMLLYRMPWPYAATLMLTGGLLFFITLFMPADFELPVDYSLAHLPGLTDAITYFPRFLSNAVDLSLFPFNYFTTGLPWLSWLFGFAGFMTLVLYSWRIIYCRNTPPGVLALPLTLAWFAVFAGVLATVGRAGAMEGMNNPSDYRYATWSAQLWIGLLWLALYHLLNHKPTALNRGLYAGLATLTTGVFALASYHALNHMLEVSPQRHIAALSMIVAPDIRQAEARRLAHLNPNAVLSPLPQMRAQRHNLFAAPWTHRLEQSLATHYEIVASPECTGIWRENISLRRSHSHVYRGWSSGPAGHFNTLLLVSHGIIVGGGQPAWIGAPREIFTMAPELPSTGMYFAGLLLGHQPGWVGVARLTEGQDPARIEVYGMLDQHRVCRLENRRITTLPAPPDSGAAGHQMPGQAGRPVSIE